MSGKKKLTHIVGTFLIKAEGAFLNGSTAETYEGNPITTPKTLKEFNNKIPYVSSQAWRHWLRETYQEENPSDPTTPIETTGIDSGESKEKYTTKKVGTNIDPVKYAEHDIFGYMAAKEGQGSKGIKATIRSSPFQSSILMSVRKSGWEGIDKGFVYPKSVAVSMYQEILNKLTEEKSKLSADSKSKVNAVKELLTKDISREDLVNELEDKLEAIKDEGGKKEIEFAINQIVRTVPTSLPYTTRFYNTHLQGVFGLAYHRIGLFRNAGDREELENVLVEKYKLEDKIKVVPTNDKNAKVYEIKNKEDRLKRTEKILRSLAFLRGGAKQAQFGTDVSPKVMVIAGLTCGNLIFNDLFEDTKEFVTSPIEKRGADTAEIIESKVVGGTRIKLNTLKQVISDYADRIITPVYIGIRSGYLSRESESELVNWVGDDTKWQKDVFGNSSNVTKQMPAIQLCSPVEAIENILAELKKMES